MIFIDTNALLSLVVLDEFHDRALQWWQENREVDLVTSNLVVMETLGWVRHKVGRQKAIDIGKRLYESGELKLERMTMVDEGEAWRLFQKVFGRGYSMIDCVSIVMMKRLKIKKVFTFDRDFAKAGLTVVP